MAPSTTYGPVETVVGRDASSSGMAHGQMRMAALGEMDSEHLMMAFSMLQGGEGGAGAAQPPPEFWYIGGDEDPLGLTGTPGGAQTKHPPANRPPSSAVSAAGSTRSKASKRGTTGPGYLGANKDDPSSPDRRRILSLHKEVWS